MSESMQSHPETGSLQCSVLLTQRGQPQPVDWWMVEIRGPVGGCTPGATLTLWIEDITEAAHPFAVLERTAGSPTSDDRPFSYKTPMTCVQGVGLSTWAVTIQIDTTMLWLARQGRCVLAFRAEVASAQPPFPSIRGQSTFVYQNPMAGFLDLREGLQEARTLAIALALAVGAADGRLSGQELGYVRGWALSELDLASLSLESKRRFETSLQKLARLFIKKVPVDIQEVCHRIIERAPVAHRYDILEFCVVVAGASGHVGEGKLSLLKDLAEWLQLDPERWRAMMGKAIPMEAFKVIDATVLLGLRSDMSKEDALRQLNHEYSKWNARVTNPDHQVRNQADQMIHLIAHTRHRYVV
jgi:tellurite resistance protein